MELTKAPVVVQTASMYGTTDTASADAEGGLYGAGRFTYSENQFSASVAASDSGSAAEVLYYSDLGADDAYSASVVAGEVFYFEFQLQIMTNLILKVLKDLSMHLRFILTCWLLLYYLSLLN